MHWLMISLHVVILLPIIFVCISRTRFWCTLITVGLAGIWSGNFRYFSHFRVKNNSAPEMLTVSTASPRELVLTVVVRELTNAGNLDSGS